MADKSIRCFLGMALSEQDSARVQSVLAGLQSRLPDTGLRMVAPRNWHLTLAFLGDQSLAWLESVRVALASTPSSSAPMQGQASIRLNSQHIGGFPDAKGRILALTLQPEPALLMLKANVDRLLQRQGFTPESRAYQPHVTLGRFERGHAARIEPVACHGSLTFSHLTLFQSVPSAQGSEYRPLWSMPFDALRVPFTPDTVISDT